MGDIVRPVSHFLSHLWKSVLIKYSIKSEMRRLLEKHPDGVDGFVEPHANVQSHTSDQTIEVKAVVASSEHGSQIPITSTTSTNPVAT